MNNADTKKANRSKIMRAVKSKGTRIEILLTKALWRRGMRYRKNVKGIPGTPDIVFKTKKIAIFCDSEFWHGKDWEKRKNDFKSNQDFWFRKIERNIQKDREVNAELTKQGWTVIRFWGKEIEKNLDICCDTVEKVVRSQ